MATAIQTEVPYGGMAYLRKMSVEEYEFLVKGNVLGPEDNVELLEGYMVLKMSRGHEHDFALQELADRLYEMVPKGKWKVRGQSAAKLSDSVPEPDFVVARGDGSIYRQRHPLPTELALVIEVSDSSLSRDTQDKARIYARAKVPVYWVVNIPDRRIEVYTEPSGPTEEPKYQTRTEYPVGGTVPVVLDGTQVGTIAVADVIP